MHPRKPLIYRENAAAKWVLDRLPASRYTSRGLTAALPPPIPSFFFFSLRLR